MQDTVALDLSLPISSFERALQQFRGSPHDPEGNPLRG